MEVCCATCRPPASRCAAGAELRRFPSALFAGAQHLTTLVFLFLVSRPFLGYALGVDPYREAVETPEAPNVPPFPPATSPPVPSLYPASLDSPELPPRARRQAPPPPYNPRYAVPAAEGEGPAYRVREFAAPPASVLSPAAPPVDAALYPSKELQLDVPLADPVPVPVPVPRRKFTTRHTPEAAEAYAPYPSAGADSARGSPKPRAEAAYTPYPLLASSVREPEAADDDLSPTPAPRARRSTRLVSPEVDDYHPRPREPPRGAPRVRRLPKPQTSPSYPFYPSASAGTSVQASAPPAEDAAAQQVYARIYDLFRRLGEPFPPHQRDSDYLPWWHVKGMGYDYSEDFYATTDSLKHVKEEGARLAIELIQATLRGTPAYPERQLKTVIMWKQHARDQWEIVSEAVMVPAGHNPLVAHLFVAVMLNLTEHVDLKCAHRLAEMEPQVEARFRADDSRTVRVLQNRDLESPLRDFAEIRLIFERTSNEKKTAACVGDLSGRLRSLLPRRMYQPLPTVPMQTVLLIPTPGDRPLDTYDPPSQDGLVVYNFVQPFRTSVLTQIEIKKNTDLVLGQLSSMLLKAALPTTEQCGLMWTRLTPAYTALVEDASGSLYHVPLSKKTLSLRQLLDVAQVVKRRTNREVNITLNVFFPALLRSEAVAVHRCQPNLWKQLVPRHTPVSGARIHVLINVACDGLVKARCKRRAVAIRFSNPFATVADALLAIRPFIRQTDGEGSIRSPPACFGGYARLKKKVKRLFNIGHPWREIGGSVRLSDLRQETTELLLAPRVSHARFGRIPQPHT
ncbi:hypothetical protein BESB_017570 [Besnoitia besnoiti]|uniref:Uncharacterized protein n=1 Tax=Besnoitia besnoiti TaxID=94643 RepID=A0A2A9M3C6_BESBE|nr:hypothetical protein BESB_017570 [Besnoitia besnoiti]PFH32439.1 hypothetical protein BESB_017570 [Besnoitia besnoiti]